MAKRSGSRATRDRDPLGTARPFAATGDGSRRPALVVLGEDHLRRLLREYVDYYNAERVHTSISDAPEGRPVQDRPSVYVLPFLLLADLRLGLAWSILAGVFAFAVYASYWTGGLPLYSSFGDGGYPMPTPLLGLAASAVVVVALARWLRRGTDGIDGRTRRRRSPIFPANRTGR